MKAAAVASALRAQAAALVAIAEALEQAPSAPASPIDEWLDARSCAPLSRRRVLSLVARGELPASRDGRRVLVRRSDLDAFFAANRERRAPRVAAPPDAGVAKWLAAQGIRRGGRAA